MGIHIFICVVVCIHIHIYIYKCIYIPARRNAQVAVLDTYTGEAKAALLLANSTGRRLEFRESLSIQARSTRGGISDPEGQWEGTVLPFGTAFGIPDGTYQARGSCHAEDVQQSHNVPYFSYFCELGHVAPDNYCRHVLCILGHPQRRKCRLEDPCSFHCGEGRKRLSLD